MRDMKIPGKEKSSTKFLVGDRIYLRPIEPEDLPLIQKWINDPEIRILEGEVLPKSMANEKQWLENIYKDKSRVWFVVALKNNDKTIGDGGFLRIDYIWRAADLSIMIGKKGEWSKGYGTEAIRLLLKYGFEFLNFHRISLGVFDFNKRAIHAYEKAGFKKEGVLRDGYYCDNKYHDVIMMSILEDEFKELKK